MDDGTVNESDRLSRMPALHDPLAAALEDELEPFSLWEVKVSVDAVATYQAYSVGFGVDPSAGQRQLLVRLSVSVAVHAPGAGTAQSMIPEVLASWDSDALLAAAQIFTLGQAPPPPRQTIRRVTLLNPDNLIVQSVRQLT